MCVTIREVFPLYSILVMRRSVSAWEPMCHLVSLLDPVPPPPPSLASPTQQVAEVLQNEERNLHNRGMDSERVQQYIQNKFPSLYDFVMGADRMSWADFIREYGPHEGVQLVQSHDQRGQGSRLRLDKAGPLESPTASSPRWSSPQMSKIRPRLSFDSPSPPGTGADTWFVPILPPTPRTQPAVPRTAMVGIAVQRPSKPFQDLPPIAAQHTEDAVVQRAAD